MFWLMRWYSEKCDNDEKVAAIQCEDRVGYWTKTVVCGGCGTNRTLPCHVGRTERSRCVASDVVQLAQMCVCGWTGRGRVSRPSIEEERTFDDWRAHPTTWQSCLFSSFSSLLSLSSLFSLFLLRTRTLITCRWRRFYRSIMVRRMSVQHNRFFIRVSNEPLVCATTTLSWNLVFSLANCLQSWACDWFSSSSSTSMFVVLGHLFIQFFVPRW